MFRATLGTVLIFGSYFWAILVGAVQIKTDRDRHVAWFAFAFMVLFAALGERLTRM